MARFTTTLGLVASLSLAACSDAPQDSHQGPTLPALEQITLTPSQATREVIYDGVVEAIHQATVSAQTSGRIEELPVDVGDYVAKGDLIVRITDSEQKARLASAEAQWLEAKANFARMEEMLAKKVIAKADFDRAQAAYKSAEANWRQADEQLKYTRIHAPYAGIVVSRAVKVGEAVAPGTALMTGLSLEQLRVQVAIPQQHIGPVRKFKQARVQIAPGHWLAAGELRIPPSADPQSQSFPVLVNLPQGELNLFPGTLVKIAFAVGSDEQLRLPASAIAQRGDLRGAYVIANQRLEFRQLRLGSAGSDQQLPVLAGLRAGEVIAADPVAAAAAYRAQFSQPQGNTASASQE